MGVNLAPIVHKEILTLQDLKSRSFAIDGNNVLYQFLALIRLPDGRPLTSRDGRTTSHLTGLIHRATRLIGDYRMTLTFVFDGKPPGMKEEEIRARRAGRAKAAKEYAEAVERGDKATAWSKAVSSSRVTRTIVDDAKRLLDLLGIPWVQAPSEGEAQASYMCMKGDVWACSTRDFDALLYGSPRLVRYLTISGREFLPSKGTSRPLEPELIDLGGMLEGLRISQEQLIDLAILVGTDYNAGVKGIGPRKGLELIRRFHNLEGLPGGIREKLPSDLEGLRRLFLHPRVDEEYELHIGRFDPAGAMEFLCEELDFNRERVMRALERLRKVDEHPSLDAFASG